MRIISAPGDVDVRIEECPGTFLATMSPCVVSERWSYGSSATQISSNEKPAGERTVLKEIRTGRY